MIAHARSAHVAASHIGLRFAAVQGNIEYLDHLQLAKESTLSAPIATFDVQAHIPSNSTPKVNDSSTRPPDNVNLC